MEKISGILPQRPRLATETEPLPPVRPGAPAFGRSEGSAEIRDRVSLSSVKNIGPQEYQNYKNPKEAKHVKIVDDLSRKFFMNPSPAPEPVAPVPPINAESAIIAPPVDLSKVDAFDNYA